MVKIKKIFIRNCPPLEDAEIEFKNLHLIYDKLDYRKNFLSNLLQEIIFHRFTNVSEAIIQIDSKEYTFPYEKTLGELLNLANINLPEVLIVKSGDLITTIASGAFWFNLKEALTGINFDTLKEKIMKKYSIEENRITKILSELQDIKRKKADIILLMQGEKELKALESQYAFIKHKLALISQQERYLRYKRLKELYEEWKRAYEKYSQYENLKEDDLQRWNELEEKIFKKKSEIEARSKELIEIGARVADLKREESDKREELRKLKEILSTSRKWRITEQIDRYNKLKEELTKYTPEYFFVGLGVALSGLIVSAFGILHYAITIPGALCLLTGLFMLIRHARGRLIAEEAKEVAKFLMKSAKNLKWNGDTPESTVEFIEEKEKRAEELEKEEIPKIMENQKEMNKKMEEIKAKTKELGEELRRLEEDLEILKHRLGNIPKSELAKKLDEKKRLKELINSLTIELKKHFETDKPREWEAKLEEMKTSPPQASLNITDKEKYEELLNKLQTEIEKTKRRMEELKKEEWIPSEFYKIYLKEGELEKELEEIELDKKALDCVIKTIDSLSKRLNGIVEHAVKIDLQNYLPRFTNGQYVDIEVVDGRLYCRRSTGEHVELSALSRANQDLLAFLIKLTIAKRLLGKGFLILDEPFITMPQNMKKDLIKFMDEIKEEWQFIYLSSDENTMKIFKEIGAEITTI